MRTNFRIHKAVEALKPQVPVTEEKTAFWNSYMKLADECGKEFQQKYSSDLDAALIFVCVVSHFISILDLTLDL
jgi:uncharacterized protein (DUF983 family)